MRLTAIACAALLAVGCVPLPDVPLPPSVPEEDIEYLDFVPLDEVKLSAQQADERAAKGAEAEQQVTARAAALQARAARLRNASVN